MQPPPSASDRDRRVHAWKESILGVYLSSGQIEHYDPGTGDNVFFVRNQLVVDERALGRVGGHLERYGRRVEAPTYHLVRNDLPFAVPTSPAPGIAAFELDPNRAPSAAQVALDLTDGRLDDASPNHVVFGLQVRRGFPDGDPEPADTPLPRMPSPPPTVGAGVDVAIVDTGFPRRMPQDLEWFANGCDWHTAFGEVDDAGKPLRHVDRLDDDRDGYLDAEAGHALFVAGLVRRAAPGAKLVFLKALNADGVGTEYGVARAIRYAVRRGAHVINLSLGFYTVRDISPRGMRAAVDDARRAGAAVVAASGNDGIASPTFPASFADVIAVGAHDRSTGATAPFSNTGSWVNVTAPGVRELSCYVPGVEDPAGTRDGGSDTFDRQRTAAVWSGTSFACGHVSGHLAAHLDPASDVSPADQAAALVARLPAGPDGVRRLDPVAAF
jgi:subtilisin family serine protease